MPSVQSVSWKAGTVLAVSEDTNHITGASGCTLWAHLGHTETFCKLAVYPGRKQFSKQTCLSGRYPLLDLSDHSDRWLSVTYLFLWIKNTAYICLCVTKIYPVLVVNAPGYTKRVRLQMLWVVHLALAANRIPRPHPSCLENWSNQCIHRDNRNLVKYMSPWVRTIYGLNVYIPPALLCWNLSPQWEETEVDLHGMIRSWRCGLVDGFSC